ncbi:MAG: hypothetical protein KC451_13585, partial [Amylibacter sp.]|nr:hypothetical protein [Amylibacter sp.]
GTAARMSLETFLETKIFLELHVKVIRGRGKLWRFSGEGIVDGKVVAEAEFTAMMVPPEDQ